MEYKKSKYQGFEMLEFAFEGRECKLVIPKNPREDKKWFYKTEYFTAFPSFQIEMLNRGYYLAHMKNITRWCPDEDTDARPRFCELLNLQFSAQDMSFIPKAADQVAVGDIERLRLSDKKVVFVIGAEEGRFPTLPESGGLFNLHERTILTESGLLIDNSVHLDTLIEEYLCYYALTSASDYLFVSYSNNTLKGTPVYPSQIINRLKEIFAGLCEVESRDVNTIDRLWSADSAFSLYASRIGSTDKLTKALEEYYSENAERYIQDLNYIDKVAEEFIASSPRDTVIFADRFPFRYALHDYGIKYCAAFEGCSSDSEVTFDTVIHLSEMIDNMDIKAILVTDDSDGKIAEAVISNTNNKEIEIYKLNSMQSVSATDVKNGMRYIEVMRDNLALIHGALIV